MTAQKSNAMMKSKDMKKNTNAQRQTLVNTLISFMKKILTVVAVIYLLRSGYSTLQQHRESYGHGGQQVAFGARNQSAAKGPQQESREHFTAPSIPDDETLLSSEDKDTPSTHSKTSDDIDFASHEDTKSKSKGKGPGAQKNNNQWAIVYFPYTPLSTCKTALTVRSDIAAIRSRGFTTLRLHASDCNALHTVGTAAHLHSMRLILGIHIDSPPDELDSDPLPLAREQITDLISWASDPSTPGWSLISLLVIGEESIFNSLLPAHDLASFISTTRSRLREAGYRGPITTTEPIPTLYAHAPILCPVIDLPASNIHPFFSGSVAAPDAGAYVADALAVLDEICPESKGPAVNLETGWPSRGRRNGDAVPGEMEQSLAIMGIMREAGGRSTVIGWGDDTWRDPGELGVETAWGCERLFEEDGGLVDEGEGEGEVLEGEERGWVERDR